MSCRRQVAVGAYVLGVLDPREQRAMRRHLPRCAECTAAVADLEPLVPLLADAPPPAPAARVQRPGGMGRRWALVGAASAVLAVGAGAGIVATRDAPLPPTVAATSGAVRVQARIAPDPAGSAITLTLTGVESGEQCELVAVGRDGRRETASVWTATYEGTAQVTGTVSLPPAQLRRLVVRTLDGRILAELTG